jgi:polysaccharide biosynthesis protein PslH
LPYPPFRGDKLKIYNLAKRLCKHHQLTLVTFTLDNQDLRYKDSLNDIFHRVETIHLPKWKSLLNCSTFPLNTTPLQVLYFKSSAFRKLLTGVLDEVKPDAVHVQHLRMSQYNDLLGDYPRILDLPDAFSLYWERRVEKAKSFAEKQFNKLEQRRVLKYEKILDSFDLSLVCSQEDLDYLESVHSLNNIRLFPNGVDLETFAAMSHDYSQDKVLLFTGNMDYAPNVDAVVYFAEEILPIIKEVIPDVKFIIAGQRPVEKVKNLASKHIELTGFVQNMADYYKKASVVVAPLRFGAGTQNKVLEAISMGVPVVCSHVGFKGLGVESGEGAFMETEPVAFARRVVSLLQSAELRESTGLAGKNIITQKFDWNVLTKKLENYFYEIINKQD